MQLSKLPYVIKQIQTQTLDFSGEGPACWTFWDHTPLPPSRHTDRVAFWGDAKSENPQGERE